MRYSVVEACGAAGVDTDSRDHWALAHRIRRAYIKKTGNMPLHQLRPKTDPDAAVNAPHMHLTYPADFLPDMLEIIDGYDFDKRSQLELFK